MKTFLLIATILLFFSCTTCSAQPVDSAKVINTLNTCWRVISYEYATIYGLEDEEIKRYAKQKICFTSDSITMFTHVLCTPKYAVRRVNAQDYAKENFDCDKDKLGIVNDSVFEITISSFTKPTGSGKVHKMTDVITMDEDCIYVVLDGVIFKLFDVNRKIERKGAN